MTPPFEGSDVPLEEDILKKPIEFVKSWIEWSAVNREQVFSNARAFATTSAVRIFMVPDNNTLFITNLTHSLAVAGGVFGGGVPAATSVVSLTGSAKVLSLISYYRNPDLIHESLSHNFPMPIKVESGEQVKLQHDDTTSTSRASIFGFLVPKRIS